MLSKISAWYRVAIICSILWVLGALILIDPWTRSSGFSSFGNSFSSRNNWNEFILVGIIPVLFFWGGLWIINGFKDRGNNKKQNKPKKKIFGRAKRKLTPEMQQHLIKFYHDAKSKGLDPQEMIRQKMSGKKEVDLMERFINEELEWGNNENPGPPKIENSQSNKSEEKTICPICSSIFQKVNGKTDSDGISICSDCYAKRDLDLNSPEKSSYLTLNILLTISMLLNVVPLVLYIILDIPLEQIPRFFGFLVIFSGVMYHVFLGMLASRKNRSALKWIFFTLVIPLAEFVSYFMIIKASKLPAKKSPDQIDKEDPFEKPGFILH